MARNNNVLQTVSLLWKPPSNNRDEHNVVDSKHDFHHGQCQQRKNGLTRKKERSLARLIAAAPTCDYFL